MAKIENIEMGNAPTGTYDGYRVQHLSLGREGRGRAREILYSRIVLYFGSNEHVLALQAKLESLHMMERIAYLDKMILEGDKPENGDENLYWILTLLGDALRDE